MYFVKNTHMFWLQ